MSMQKTAAYCWRPPANRTNLVKDALSGELVAYFSLRMGLYAFKKFVLPIVQRMSVYVGVNALYVYALPEEKLIEHYRTMGFSRLPEHQEKFVQRHVKPKYDEGCIFMYQVI